MSQQLIGLTGATGFLGSHIADTLLARGFSLRAAVRSTSNLRWVEGKGIDLVVVDLGDQESCAHFLAGTSGLIHCAGAVTATNEEQYRQANVATTRNLLAGAQKAWEKDTSAAFVLISSMAAHGPAGLDNPAHETNTPGPITAYGRSKLAAEQAVGLADWTFRRVVLRPPSLYGPRDAEFLPLFKAATKGITARMGRSMTGLSLVHGRDAASAAVALLECEQAAGTFFVDDGQRGYDWQELASVLASVTGKKIRTLPVPLWVLKFVSLMAGPIRSASSPVLNRDRIRDLETRGWVCDGALLRQTTGWSPEFNASTGFADTMKFFKEQGWL
jgi:nucleoside-diphosphate-sugar epimerase